MVVEGIYYSRLKEELKFMWAFHIKGQEYPAHFGGRDLFDVTRYFVDPVKHWAYAEEDRKYLVLQKDMIKWKDQ